MRTMKHYWLPTILLIVAIALVAGCASTNKVSCSKDSGCGAPPPPPAPVADTDLSYRNEPLIDDSGAPALSFEAADPGDSDLIVRAFENAPPVIPHNVDGLLPIMIDDNQCAGCHLPDEVEDSGATSVPASHLYDFRQDRQLTGLNPANFNCTQCHTAWVDNGDLVENTFAPDFRVDDHQTSSNLIKTMNEGVR
jgi:nitrate reductase (cytochrome), electron transfer subunit